MNKEKIAYLRKEKIMTRKEQKLAKEREKYGLNKEDILLKGKVNRMLKRAKLSPMSQTYVNKNKKTIYENAREFYRTHNQYNMPSFDEKVCQIVNGKRFKPKSIVIKKEGT